MFCDLFCQHGHASVWYEILNIGFWNRLSKKKPDLSIVFFRNIWTWRLLVTLRLLCSTTSVSCSKQISVPSLFHVLVRRNYFSAHLFCVVPNSAWSSHANEWLSSQKERAQLPPAGTTLIKESDISKFLLSPGLLACWPRWMQSISASIISFSLRKQITSCSP